MAIKMKTALLGDTAQRKSERAERGSEGHNVFTAVKVLEPEAFSVSWQQHRNVRTFLFFQPRTLKKFQINLPEINVFSPLFTPVLLKLTLEIWNDR